MPARSAPLDARGRVRRISMVYDADGGLAGEARYVVGHLLGRVHCDLCDITHGPVRRKAAFDELVAALQVPVDVLHRNEQGPELAAFTAGRLACVVGDVEGELVELVGRERLAACAGRVKDLAAALAEALAARDDA